MTIVRILYVVIATALFCTPIVVFAEPDISDANKSDVMAEDISPVNAFLSQLPNLDLLIVSDHTKASDFNNKSAGAEDIERDFIDPAVAILVQEANLVGLKVAVLNVEDMLPSGVITDESAHKLAYEHFDSVLQASAEYNLTVVSLHFDADIVMAHQRKDEKTYIGGAHLVQDDRNLSDQSFKLAYYLLHDHKLLSYLQSAGFRIRPGYEQQVKYKKNITMNYTGSSEGGAVMIQLAALNQAIRKANNGEQTAKLMQPALKQVALAVEGFRRQTKLKR